MIKGFKGFNKNLQCTPKDKKFQYEIGKDYEEPTADACDSGFHFCEYPLDVFSYYAPADSRYFEVEGDGTISRKGDDDDDSKVACSKLKIGVEIGIKGIIEASVKFIFDKVDFKNAAATNTGDYSAATNTGDCSAATNTGDYSAATNTGYCSAATNTGDCSAATNTGDCSAATNTGYCSAATNTGYCSAATNTGYCSTATNTGYCSAATNTGYCSAATNTGDCSAATNTGNCSAATNTGYCSAATNTGNCSAATNTGYCSAATVEGKESIAVCTGYKGKAKGSLGCWIALAEWNDGNDHIINFKSAPVDGVNIKADTFYMLVNGKFVEWKEDD